MSQFIIALYIALFVTFVVIKRRCLYFHVHTLCYFPLKTISPLHTRTLWFPRAKTPVSVSALNGRGDRAVVLGDLAEVILLLSAAKLHGRWARALCEISKALVLGGMGCLSPTVKDVVAQ